MDCIPCDASIPVELGIGTHEYASDDTVHRPIGSRALPIQQPRIYIVPSPTGTTTTK
jgi:hypothetical protein